MEFGPISAQFAMIGPNLTGQLKRFEVGGGEEERRGGAQVYR